VLKRDVKLQLTNRESGMEVPIGVRGKTPVV